MIAIFEFPKEYLLCPLCGKAFGLLSWETGCMGWENSATCCIIFLIEPISLENIEVWKGGFFMRTFREKSRFLLATILVVFLLPCLAGGANLAKGIDAYQRRDYKTAYEEFLPLAEQGDPQAQCELGFFFLKGLGRPRDFGEAFRWFLRSAMGGYSPAQCQVGNCFLMGEGTTRSLSEAKKWYRKSAEGGDLVAYASLIRALGAEDDGGKSCEETRKWLALLCQEGEKTAYSFIFRDIGTLYLEGLHFPPDYAEAAKWLKKAASRNDPPSLYHLGTLYDNGLGVSQDASEAFRLYRLSAEYGSPAGMMAFANMLEEGRVCPANEAEAYKWYKLAFHVDRKSGGKMNEIDLIRLSGILTKKERAEADQWLTEWLKKTRFQ